MKARMFNRPVSTSCPWVLQVTREEESSSNRERRTEPAEKIMMYAVVVVKGVLHVYMLHGRDRRTSTSCGQGTHRSSRTFCPSDFHDMTTAYFKHHSKRLLLVACNCVPAHPSAHKQQGQRLGNQHPLMPFPSHSVDASA